MNKNRNCLKNKKDIVVNNNSYFWATNNCVQVSIDVLRKGTFKSFNYTQKLLLLLLSGRIIPNVIYRRFKMFYWKPFFYSCSIKRLRSLTC